MVHGILVLCKILEAFYISFCIPDGNEMGGALTNIFSKLQGARENKIDLLATNFFRKELGFFQDNESFIFIFSYSGNEIVKIVHFACLLPNIRKLKFLILLKRETYFF